MITVAEKTTVVAFANIGKKEVPGSVLLQLSQ